jgi:hypothetical protein
MPIFNVHILKSLHLLKIMTSRRIGLPGVDFLEVSELLLLHDDSMLAGCLARLVSKEKEKKIDYAFVSTI